MMSRVAKEALPARKVLGLLASEHEHGIIEFCFVFFQALKLFHFKYVLTHRSFQFSSVAQLCPTLCNPMNHSTPGLPVPHQLPESNQIHVL